MYVNTFIHIIYDMYFYGNICWMSCILAHMSSNDYSQKHGDGLWASPATRSGFVCTRTAPSGTSSALKGKTEVEGSITDQYPGDPGEIPISLTYPWICRKYVENHYIYLAGFLDPIQKKFSARPHPAWTKLPRVTSKISTSWWSLCLFSWTWSCCESDGPVTPTDLPWWK